MSPQSDFSGEGRPLGRDGLANAATHLGVGPIELWTVVAVETSSCGFYRDRRPRILYERHHFHELTAGRFDDGDISDAEPGGYGHSPDEEYQRLARAVVLDRAAALRSTSWGLGQVLGSNHVAAGYADVEAFVAAMRATEDQQLAAMAGFIAANKLSGALQSHDWKRFAEGYNGANYAINEYDTKLAAAFTRYSAGPLPDLDVRAAQLLLFCLGYDPGPVDGEMGTRTRAAIQEFQRTKGMPPTGDVNAQLLAALSA